MIYSPKPFVLLNHLTEPSAMPRAPSGTDERTTREKEASIFERECGWGREARENFAF